MNESIIEKIKQFNKERDWDKFHSPKNLAMSVSIEAAELLECFQWMAENQEITEKDKVKISEEVADVFIYLISLSDKLGINIEASIFEKITKNTEKYPIEKSKGNSTKYTEL